MREILQHISDNSCYLYCRDIDCKFQRVLAEILQRYYRAWEKDFSHWQSGFAEILRWYCIQISNKFLQRQCRDIAELVQRYFRRIFQICGAIAELVQRYFRQLSQIYTEILQSWCRDITEMFQAVFAKHCREIVDILQKSFREVADNLKQLLHGCCRDMTEMLHNSSDRAYWDM